MVFKKYFSIVRVIKQPNTAQYKNFCQEGSVFGRSEPKRSLNVYISNFNLKVPQNGLRQHQFFQKNFGVGDFVSGSVNHKF